MCAVRILGAIAGAIMLNWAIWQHKHQLLAAFHPMTHVQVQIESLGECVDSEPACYRVRLKIESVQAQGNLFCIGPTHACMLISYLHVLQHQRCYGMQHISALTKLRSKRCCTCTA